MERAVSCGASRASQPLPHGVGAAVVGDQLLRSPASVPRACFITAGRAANLWMLAGATQQRVITPGHSNGPSKRT